MVGVTGCGCPADTSVRSTEAPTEAAAETLNPWLPLAVLEIHRSLFTSLNFDRCATVVLPASATSGGRTLCLVPHIGSEPIGQIKKHPPVSECFSENGRSDGT